MRPHTQKAPLRDHDRPPAGSRQTSAHRRRRNRDGRSRDARDAKSARVKSGQSRTRRDEVGREIGAVANPTGRNRDRTKSGQSRTRQWRNREMDEFGTVATFQPLALQLPVTRTDLPSLGPDNRGTDNRMTSACSSAETTDCPALARSRHPRSKQPTVQPSFRSQRQPTVQPSRASLPDIAY
jgi:hypothetical protein